MFHSPLQSGTLNSKDCFVQSAVKHKAERAAGRPSYRTEQASVTTDMILTHDKRSRGGGGLQSSLLMSNNPRWAKAA